MLQYVPLMVSHVRAGTTAAPSCFVQAWSYCRGHRMGYCRDECARGHCRGWCKGALQGLVQGGTAGAGARGNCRGWCKGALQGLVQGSLLQGLMHRGACMGPLHCATGQWKSPCSYQIHRHAWNVCHVVQGQYQELYLTGGNDGTRWLDALEIFSPSRGSWRTGQAMPLERGYGAAAAIEQQLYVMGGGNGSSWLQSVMMCNLRTGDWLEVPC